MSRGCALAATVLLAMLLARPLSGESGGEGAGQPSGTESEADLAERIEDLESQVEILKRDVVATKALVEALQPDIDARSTLRFELDVLTGGTAFTNENEIDITIPLARGTVSEREESRGLTATFTLSRFNVEATDEGLAVSPGSIDARLAWGDYFLQVSRAPEFLLDKAQAFSSRSENVRTNTVTAAGGVAVGREARGSSIALLIGSYNDDSRYNYKNQYGFGLDVVQRVIRSLLSVEGGVTYGMQGGYLRDENIGFTSRDFGLSIMPKVTVPGLGLGVEAFAAADFLLPFDAITRSYADPRFDARLDAAIRLSETAALEDGSTGYSRVGVSLYGVPLEGVYDAQIVLVELPGSAGFAPVLGFDATFLLLDILDRGGDGFGFEVGGGLQATFGSERKVVPFVRSSYRSANASVALNLGAKVKLIGDTVELKAEYESTDISHYNGDMGRLGFQCTVTYR